MVPFRVQKDEPVRHISIVMVGDTGYAPSRAAPRPNTVSKHGHRLTFAQTTAKIRAEINGDVNFANMESVISDSARLRPFPKKYNFVTHSNGARHLVDVGFNLFSMANNHSYDYGAEGIRHSIKHADRLLDRGLLAHAGIGLNRTQAAAVPVFTSQKTRMAFGAIGIGAGGGGIQRARANSAGQLNLNNPSDVGLLMGNLRNADADYRILSVHRGPERYIRPGGGEIHSIRNKMLEQGDVDLLIGHHAHVTRGIEITNGRLVIYGLGNFLHHGTANMNGKGGCRDYSLIVRVHLAQKGSDKPQLAAIEALPINFTHLQTRRMKGAQAARRIAILNGLAAQFDNPKSGSRGVRFLTRRDGSGLFCTQAADQSDETRALCEGYDEQLHAPRRTYARAVNSCGRINAKPLLAAMGRQKVQTAKAKLPKVLVAARPQAVEARPVPASTRRGAVSVPVQLKRNPAHWPAGMPLAWMVPEHESHASKRARWAKKRYSLAEVENLLKRRKLLR